MKKTAVGDNILSPIKTVAIEQAGLTKKNCVIVFTQDRPIKSWEPGRSINAIKELEEGKNYLVRMKKASELKAFKNEQL